MRAARTILVCGVPGVGKTTLIRSSIENLPDASFLEARDVIAHAAQSDEATGMFPTSPAHRVARHFQLLVHGFTAERASRGNDVMILESASVVDTEAGWFEAPIHALKTIAPSMLVHVEDDCEKIAERRFRDRAAVRLTRSPIELARYQERSLRACERHAARLGCSLHRLPVHARDHFESLVRGLTPNRAL
jgi:adenylate kinase